MSKKFLIHCFAAATLALAACGDDGDDSGGDPQPDSGVLPDAGGGVDAGGADAGGNACDGLTYENYGKNVLSRTGFCLGCHSATPTDNTVRLDTLENVRTHANDIIQHAVEPRSEPKMPQNLPALPAEDQAKLKKWLQCGAP